MITKKKLKTKPFIVVGESKEQIIHQESKKNINYTTEAHIFRPGFIGY